MMKGDLEKAKMKEVAEEMLRATEGTIVDLRDPANPRAKGKWTEGLQIQNTHDVTEVKPGVFKKEAVGVDIEVEAVDVERAADVRLVRADGLALAVTVDRRELPTDRR